VLEGSLRLLHPIMPFLTEEIWQKLPVPKPVPSVMTASYPDPEDYPYDKSAEEELSLVMEVIKALRNIRGENDIGPGARVPAILIVTDESAGALLEGKRVHIESLGKLRSLDIQVNGAAPEKTAAQTVSGVEVHIPLEGLVDFAEELKRLEKENAKVEKSLGVVKKKLANEQFLENAPPEVVEKEKDKHAEMQERLDAVQKNIERIKKYI